MHTGGRSDSAFSCIFPQELPVLGIDGVEIVVVSTHVHDAVVYRRRGAYFVLAAETPQGHDVATAKGRSAKGSCPAQTTGGPETH